jgi:hypothetical protein
MCSGVQKKSHFYSMPPLHRATAKDGEKAAKSCPCRAVGAVEAPPPNSAHQLTLYHPGGKKYAHHITICPPPDFQTSLRLCLACRIALESSI